MTTVDARGRDRVQGPKELAYERSTRVTTWVIAGLWAFAAMTWIVWATQDPYEPGLVALMWLAALAFLLGLAVLPARLVIGALRAAAEAADE